MKTKLIIALLSAATLAPLAAQAAGPGQSYVGVNVGRSEQEVDYSIGKSDDADTSWKLYGGYQFTPNLGVEAGYLKHGEATLPLSGIIIDSKARSLYLAGTGTVPLSEQFALFGKLGLANNKVKFIHSSLGADDESKTRAFAGVGASFAFTPAVSAVVEYERFGKLVDEGGLSIKANVLSVGLRSSF